MLPLNEVVFDFYDRLKSVSAAAMPASTITSRSTKKATWSRCRSWSMTIRSMRCRMIVNRQRAEGRGRAMCEKLKDLIPRHMFKIPIQAAIGGKVIARETLSAPCARTSPPNAMAATSAASASSWTSRKRARRRCASSRGRTSPTISISLFDNPFAALSMIVVRLARRGTHSRAMCIKFKERSIFAQDGQDPDPGSHLRQSHRLFDAFMPCARTSMPSAIAATSAGKRQLLGQAEGGQKEDAPVRQGRNSPGSLHRRAARWTTTESALTTPLNLA